MARYVLQWEIHNDRAKKTFRGPIYLDTTVTYLVLYQFVSLSVYIWFMWTCYLNFYATKNIICFINLIGMSLMEAKSDLLRECKIKFVHTFQVRFWIRKLCMYITKIIYVYYKNYIYLCFSDFVWILVAGAICELSIDSAVFSSDICQYCCFLLGQHFMLFEKFTRFRAENRILRFFVCIHILYVPERSITNRYHC